MILSINRNDIIKPKHIDSIVKIHNGKIYSEFLIIKQMLGLKFGSLLSTRSNYYYKKQKNFKSLNL